MVRDDNSRKEPTTQLKNPLLRQFLSQLPGGASNSAAAHLYPQYCSTVISSWWRMAAVRWRLRYNRFEKIAYSLPALVIQNTWRQFLRTLLISGTYGLGPPPVSQENLSASAIQNCFRKWTGRRVFAFYKDLISFRLTGDPKSLLKTINPTEAILFDKSTKIHVRFRLGGRSFPPGLFYKVYTSGAISDVGSFAPRDYAGEGGGGGIAGVPPESMHNTSVLSQEDFPERFNGTVTVGKSKFNCSGVVGKDENTDGWYRRVERNDWREVTVKGIRELSPDGGFDGHGDRAEEKEVKQHFHFSKLVRKKDAELTKKRRKREWLRKMYMNGLAEEKKEGQLEAIDMQAGVVKGLINQGKAGGASMYLNHMEETGGMEAIEIDEGGIVDVEVENLLNWTEELDYEEYVGNWSNIGTSAGTGGEEK